jgi:hypothetical protein
MRPHPPLNQSSHNHHHHRQSPMMLNENSNGSGPQQIELTKPNHPSLTVFG